MTGHLLGSKAKIIVELANGPITPEADEILFNSITRCTPFPTLSAIRVCDTSWLLTALGVSPFFQ
jgi:hypothetical protein